MKKQLLLTAIALFGIVASRAQTSQSSQAEEPQKNKIELSLGFGVEGLLRVTNSYGVHPAAVQPMILVEGRFSERSAVVLEAYYDYNFNMIEIPLMYKYYTKIVNIALGPEIGIPLGKEHVSSMMGASKSHCDYSIGAMLKVSKGIRMGQDAVFEPYISVNPSATIRKPHQSEFNCDLAAGLSFKWRL